ncbi:hypothetical protein HDV00_011678 [Rhizophlyctis rosea]|nr:hypothetical protein HDV00_011678 [Rhizophlyctis rosea]
MAIQLESINTADNASTRRIILFSVVAIFLLGAPIWWKTTEILRAPLPFSDIRRWAEPGALDLKVPLNLGLEVTTPDNKQSKPDAVALSKLVEERLVATYASAAGSIVERIEGGEPAAGSVNVLFTFNVHGNSAKRSAERDGNNEYRVLVACKGSEAGNDEVVIGKTGQITIRTSCSSDQLPDRVAAVIAGLFANEQRKYLASARKQENSHDHDNMRMVKYASEYQLAFSLLNGDPGDANVSWDIQNGIDYFISPFLNAISNLSDFSVSSQIQHYAALPIQPEAGNSVYYLRPHNLPHFINSAEWNLGQRLSTNAFLIPRWGGIVVRDPPASNLLDLDNLQPVMELFVAQLRGLLGVKESSVLNADKLLPGVKITYEPDPTRGITAWELDRLIRERTVQNLVDAVTTVNSLAKLIEDGENMVVLDEIRTKVITALDAIQKCHTSLQSSSDPSIALSHSRTAILNAESAFFDPTMVSMLYFPDEHKYAIYMPLFVPVCVPVLAAFVSEVKGWVKKRREGRGKRKVE